MIDFSELLDSSLYKEISVCVWIALGLYFLKFIKVNLFNAKIIAVLYSEKKKCLQECILNTS